MYLKTVERYKKRVGKFVSSHPVFCSIAMCYNFAVTTLHWARYQNFNYVELKNLDALNITVSIPMIQGSSALSR